MCHEKYHNSGVCHEEFNVQVCDMKSNNVSGVCHEEYNISGVCHEEYDVQVCVMKSIIIQVCVSKRV